MYPPWALDSQTQQALKAKSDALEQLSMEVAASEHANAATIRDLQVLSKSHVSKLHNPLDSSIIRLAALRASAPPHAQTLLQASSVRHSPTSAVRVLEFIAILIMCALSSMP